eukprot:528053-Prorocentrum_minimum.AAC.2
MFSTVYHTVSTAEGVAAALKEELAEARRQLTEARAARETTEAEAEAAAERVAAAEGATKEVRARN